MLLYLQLHGKKQHIRALLIDRVMLQHEVSPTGKCYFCKWNDVREVGLLVLDFATFPGLDFVLLENTKIIFTLLYHLQKSLTRDNTFKVVRMTRYAFSSNLI